MLDVKFIKENLEEVKQNTALKNCEVDFDTLLKLDTKRRGLLKEAESKKALRNKANDEISQLKKEKKDFVSKIEEMKTVSSEIKDLDNEISEIEEKLKPILEKVPNMSHKDVPKAQDAKGNEIIREWGEKSELTHLEVDVPPDHFEIGERNGYTDFKRASKITGSGFALFKDFGARLERALINFMLDFHIKNHGYTEISPPFLVNRDSMFGTGQLPKLEEDMYRTSEDDLFLIPTAEVPLTNIFRDEILNEKDLPIYYTAYTPCFRREAGSYGKDTKGLSRVHQFDKVELVKFATAESSYEEHEKLLTNAEAILQALELPYRVVLLAAGDTSFAAAKCYDLEVWGPVSEKWFEVSSCSNFEDFQARRANIRYRDKDGKVNFIHTLNASGVAMPRIMIALFENYQDKEGKVQIESLPKALQSYLK